MGWIAVYRVPPPQMAGANRVSPALMEEGEGAGERIPTQGAIPTIPSVASPPTRR